MPDEMIECDDGELRPESEVVITDFGGHTIPADEAVELADGRTAWVDDEEIVHCEDGEYRLTENCTEINGSWYSDHYVTSCDSCSESILRYDSYEARGDILCEECYQNQRQTCTNCGDSFADEDPEALCWSCRRRSAAIVGYSDKSSGRLPREHQGPELLGVELEVEPRDCDRSTAVQWVRKHLPPTYAVLKEDGSVPNGFEIVTRPDSMEVHKKFFGPLLEDTEGRKVESWKSGRCGMHVHINRKWLSSLQLGKMLVFLNEDGNRRFVTGIAGRSESHWSKMKKKKVSDVLKHDERYVALNIGTATAEVRIFRGTVSKAGFMKNLEFVRALVEYTAPGGRSIADSTSWRKFAAWVDRKAYPNLFDYLCERGHRVPPKPKPKKEGE